MKTLTDIQKLTIEVFRYYAPICALFMLHHVLALLLGYDLCIHDAIVDSSAVAFVMQIMLSFAFGFCNWHRACIVYTFVVSLCVNYERSVGFGVLRDPLRWIVLVAGFVILIMFIIRCMRHEVHSNIFNQQRKG